MKKKIIIISFLFNFAFPKNLFPKPPVFQDEFPHHYKKRNTLRLKPSSIIDKIICHVCLHLLSECICHHIKKSYDAWKRAKKKEEEKK